MKIVIGVAAFDIQKIKNPEISGKEYQNGVQKDSWNVREYVPRNLCLPNVFPAAVLYSILQIHLLLCLLIRKSNHRSRRNRPVI